jgi:hypothetical protein
MDSDDLFQLAGTLTLTDIVRFQYFDAIRRDWPVRTITVLVLWIALLGGIAVLLGSGAITGRASLGFFFAATLSWAPVMLANPYLMARRQYHRQLNLREPIQFRFTDSGIQLRGLSFSGEITWVLVHRVDEAKTAFLIYQGSRSAWILPKRFFRADAEIKSWKEFAIGRLAKTELFRSHLWVGAWL